MNEERESFLYTPVGPESKEGGLKQSKLAPMRGVEWLCSQFLREIANNAVEQAELMEGVAEWEEWEVKRVKPRGGKEERELWRELDEMDKLDYRMCKAKKKKEATKVAKARIKMGANSKQRSIKDIMSVAQLRSTNNTKSKTEGGRCVAAQTGSKSNTVHFPNLVTVPVLERESQSGGENKLEASGEGGGCVIAQTGSVSNTVYKTYQKNKNAIVQSINGGHPDGEKQKIVPNYII